MRTFGAAVLRAPAVEADSWYREEVERLGHVAKAAREEAESLRLRAETDRRELQALRDRLDEEAGLAVERERALFAQREHEMELRKRFVQQLGQSADLQGALEAERVLRRRAERAEAVAKSYAAHRDRGACGATEAPLSTALLSEQQSFIRRLVAIEAEALQGVSSDEERARARRRMLAKWHPDKNAHSAEFATQVLQELQRHPGW